MGVHHLFERHIGPMSTVTKGTKRCGHECSCPSKLHHDVRQIMAHIAAPIPVLSANEIHTMLSDALEDDTARDEEE